MNLHRNTPYARMRVKYLDKSAKHLLNIRLPEILQGHKEIGFSTVDSKNTKMHTAGT